MGDLVRAAAETLIRAAADYDAAKAELRKLLLANGADPHPPRPTQAARPGAKTRPQKQHPSAAMAAKAEAEILELLKSSPMRTAELARMMRCGVTTAIGRLERLQARRLVQRAADTKAWRLAGGPHSGEARANPPS
jgi:hypothetical protein